MGLNERWGPQERTKKIQLFKFVNLTRAVSSTTAGRIRHQLIPKWKPCFRAPNTGCVTDRGWPCQASIISRLKPCFRAPDTGRVTGHGWPCQASVIPPLLFSVLPLGLLTWTVLYDTGGRVRWLVPLQHFFLSSRYNFLH